MSQDEREYAMKSEMTWVRSGRPTYCHLSQIPHIILFPSGQGVRSAPTDAPSSVQSLPEQ